jgi:uncharacterized protein (TIRG00374 family)
VNTDRLRLPPKKVLHPLISLVLIVIIFVVILPHYVDFTSVWDTIQQMTWLEVTTLALVSAWNLFTYWVLLVRAVPGLKLRQAMVVTEASTALANTLPGGPAFGLGLAYSMYSSWGFDRPTIALALVVSGLGDLFAKLAMPILALSLLALTGPVGFGLLVATLIGGVLLVGAIIAMSVALHSDRGAHEVGRVLAKIVSRLRGLIGKPPIDSWGDAIAAFRTQARGTLKGRWHGIIAAGLVSHFSLFLVLLLTLRHVGVSEAEVSTIEALGAFAFVRLLSALPLTPGGVGVVELGLSAALVVAGGDKAQVVAAVLVFRVLTYFIQIPFGVGTYLFWRHGRAWRQSHPESAAAGASS